MNKYCLNDEQWAAVSDPSRVSFLNASAGSGKTRCIISKIQYLLDTGNPPESLLALTFTNKAAKEMKDRLKGKADISKMQVSTIHSVCVKIIQRYVHLTRLRLPFTIYDDGDQLSIIKTVVKSKQLLGNPYDYLGSISKAKSECVTPFDPEVLQVYDQYQNILRQNNACDFDDLLVLAYECLKNNECRAYYSNLWRNILVDEFQDTSALQFLIILSIYNPSVSRSFTGVGDLNQSVYGWRGAKPENVKHLEKNYGAKMFDLTYNYRSCSEIISHANGFLQFGKPMVPKTPVTGKVSVTEFDSQEDEAERIAQAIGKMGNYDKTAVIYRVNARSLLFEQAFARHRIPYKVVGDVGFFKRKVVKDVLGALKAASNPDDRESLSRIINNPKRGFGDAKREQLLLQGRAYAEDIGKVMPAIASFLTLLDDIKGMSPARAVSEYLDRSGYRESLPGESDKYMLNAVQDMVAKYESVEELLLASNFTAEESANGVSLISAHSSKGLEYDRVFVVGVEQGLWPHQNSLDLKEEERLYYVSVTRPMRYLNVSYARTKSYRGTMVPVSPSYLFLQSVKILSK